MASHELESADDCRQRLQEAAEVLEHLHATRRLRMSTDASNTTWTDVDAAVRSALASLDVAVQATAWMECQPAPPGHGHEPALAHPGPGLRARRRGRAPGRTRRPRAPSATPTSMIAAASSAFASRRLPGICAARPASCSPPRR